MITYRPTTEQDRLRIRMFIAAQWGEPRVVAHGVVHLPETLPGFVAEQDGAWVGLLTYTIDGDQCELVSIDSLIEGRGIGTMLVDLLIKQVKSEECKRLWLITTNDNINALRFYQKRGFALVAVHRNAIDWSRKIKPAIPLIGDFGIPIRDEIELEMVFD